MKHYKIIFVFLIIVVLISSSVALGAPAQVQEVEPAVEVTGFVTTPDLEDPAEPQAITGATHFVTQGTAWVQERPKRFKLWQVKGWGTSAVHYGSSAPANEWVHLPLTFATVIDGTTLKVKKVWFCAQSTNGAVTRPTRFHVRSNGSLAGDIPVFWPTDNNYHCYSMTFGTAKYMDSLGISVRVYFGNGTDQVILYKGWAEMEP